MEVSAGLDYPGYAAVATLLDAAPQADAVALREQVLRALGAP